MVGISASTAAYYNSLGASKGHDWLSGAITAIRSSQNPAGILGALANSGNAGSIGSFLSSTKTFANNFATIATTNVSNSGSFYASIASANRKKAANERIRKALQALSDAQNKVKPQNTLPSFMYLGNGQTLDTDNGILTRSDGTKIDITTGAEVVDPASIIDFGNGSYLNTQTDILTLADGTKVDNLTGIKINITA